MGWLKHLCFKSYRRCYIEPALLFTCMERCYSSMYSVIYIYIYIHIYIEGIESYYRSDYNTQKLFKFFRHRILHYFLLVTKKTGRYSLRRITTHTHKQLALVQTHTHRHTHTSISMPKLDTYSSAYYDHQALKLFLRKKVDETMIQYLAYHTNKIIKIESEDVEEDNKNGESCASSSQKRESAIPSLENFIKGLIIGSNVQTTTLMSTVVLLKRLQKIIPKNVYGIETTRHRIFIGSLIIVAKMLNDSSPLNKHWCNYTNGLLTLLELNIIEKELLEYFNWNLKFEEQELIQSLSPLLLPIKEQILLQQQTQQVAMQQQQQQQQKLALQQQQQAKARFHDSTTSIPHSTGSMVSRMSSINRNSLFSAHSRSDSNVSIPSIPSSLCLPAMVNYKTTASSTGNKEYYSYPANKENIHSNIVTAVQVKRMNHTQPLKPSIVDAHHIANTSGDSSVNGNQQNDINSQHLKLPKELVQQKSQLRSGKQPLHQQLNLSNISQNVYSHNTRAAQEVSYI